MGLTIVISLAIENTACRQNWSTDLLPLLSWGTAAGGLGSLVCAIESCTAFSHFLKLDSIMGATIQETRQASNTKRILPDEFKPSPGVEVKVISGLDILTNNQVGI